MANSDAPSAVEIAHMSFDDLLAPLPENPRLGGTGPFVINLSTSAAPIGLPQSAVAGCEQAFLYQAQRTEDHRVRYRLRVGPFATEDLADAAIVKAREVYPSALTCTADSEDLKTLGGLQAKARATEPVAAPKKIQGAHQTAKLPPSSTLTASPVAPAAASAASAASQAALPKVDAPPTLALSPAVQALPEIVLPPTLSLSPAVQAPPKVVAPPTLSLSPAVQAPPEVVVTPTLALSPPVPPPPETARPKTTELPARATGLDAPLELLDEPTRLAPAPVLAKSVARAVPSPAKPGPAKPSGPANALAASIIAAAKANAALLVEARESRRFETTQTIRPLTPPELKDGDALKWYVIELAVAEKAFEPDSIPNLDIFSLYRLYSVTGQDQGRVRHCLRLGFFGEEVGARAVASYLVQYYEKAVVKRVSVAERERFSDLRIESRKEVDATGKHAAIEITSDPFVRHPRSVGIADKR